MKNKKHCYVTPPKEVYNRTIINSMPREGDWICYNCNNLNFAFRKKCNRCKLQTKEGNDYYGGCYFYPYSPKYNGYSSQALCDLTNTTNNTKLTKISTPKKRNHLEDPQKQNTGALKLPSVSPILKKYAQNQRYKNILQKMDDQEIFECSPLCWEIQWPQISLDFGEQRATFQHKFQSQQEQKKEIADIDNQIQEMITKIFI